jgi:GT2 family glycosyltransferase
MNIRVQSVLYNLPYENIVRSLAYLDNAALIARKAGAVQQMTVAYGDCSSTPILNEEACVELGRRFSNLAKVSYQYFAANLGSAKGHNVLLNEAASDLVMILNPDVLAAPTLFGEMIGALSRPGVGLVEARQLPIEHPKYYDPETGETSWASTACAMAPRKLFEQLQGFDADTFFLYCDDVDFSWRLQLAGYRVVHECAAVVFHDKRLTNDGGWISTPAERYYSAEAALLLTYKYSRPDLTEQYLNIFANSADEALQKARAAFELRKKTDRLPAPIDQEHRVSQFVEGAYAPHRYKSR